MWRFLCEHMFGTDFLLYIFSYFVLIILLLFNYSCLHLPTHPRHPHLLPWFCPCVLYNCSCKPFTLFPHYLLPSPLCSMSACSLFQCLWLYFACLSVLLMRFQLKVRSYGICLLPPLPACSHSPPITS